MNTKGIKDQVYYEEVLKKVKMMFPRLSADSRIAKFVKTFNEYGPCTYRSIQAKIFSDHVKNEGVSEEEWLKRHGVSYGRQSWERVQELFLQSSLDPNNKRKVLYELNQFGRDFLYCFENLIEMDTRKKYPGLAKILAKYGKTLEDIDSIMHYSDGIALLNNFNKKVTVSSITGGLPTHFATKFESYYRLCNSKDPQNVIHGQIEFCDNTLFLHTDWNGSANENLSITFK